MFHFIDDLKCSQRSPVGCHTWHALGPISSCSMAVCMAMSIRGSRAFSKKQVGSELLSQSHIYIHTIHTMTDWVVHWWAAFLTMRTSLSDLLLVQWTGQFVDGFRISRTLSSMAWDRFFPAFALSGSTAPSISKASAKSICSSGERTHSR